ncbi:MAG: hypothetical protein OEZ34_16150, partial [Spirochaetia bacterium]|nr:hypothetical protein [Spirochaetia bacterium]
FSQTVGLKYNFNTGDKELDISLNNWNIQAKADLKNTITDLSVSYSIPEVKIEAYLKVEKMEPAEILMAAMIADVADKNVEEVVEEYQENKDKGWGVIAKNMGIKPGSREFHELKNKHKKEKTGKGKKGKHSKGKGKKD